MPNIIDFEYNGKVVPVPEDKIQEFAKYHPDAFARIETDEGKHKVRSADYGAFREEYPSEPIMYDPQATIDANKKDESYLGDFAERLGAGAAGMVGSAAGVLDKIAEPINKATGTEGGFFKQIQEGANTLADKLRSRSDRYNGKQFMDLVKEGDYTGALGSGFLSATESLPQSLAIMATGGYGLAGAGLLSASDKYDQLKEDYPEMPEYKKWVNSVLTGAAESLSEVVGAGTFGKAVKNVLAKGGRAEAARMIEKNFLDRLVKLEEKHWVAVPILSEGAEEAANAIAEYAIDNMTGVKRDDNVFETVVNAAVPGAMGGAQFTPVMGAAKAYNWKQKRSATNRYNAASDRISNLFNEQERAQFDEAVNRFGQDRDGRNIEALIENVARIKGLSEADVKNLVDYTESSLDYNMYVDYVNDRINDEAKRRMNEVDAEINKDMGARVYVRVNGDENPVLVTGGTLAIDFESPDHDIDKEKSSSVIYYRDSDGKIKQVSIDHVYDVDSYVDRGTLYSEILEEARNQIIAEEEADIEFGEGDSVVLPDGTAGVIQSRMEDGSFIVVTENGKSAVFDASELSAPNQAEPQQPVAFPTDKEGNIDYAQITDPGMYHDALVQEFGDDATAAATEYLASIEDQINKAEKMTDPIKRRRKLAELEQKRQFFEGVTQLFPQSETPQNDTQATDESTDAQLEDSSQPITTEQTALGRIPVDPNTRNPLFEKADSETALDALYEITEGDDAAVDAIVNAQAKQAKADLETIKKKIPVKNNPTLSGTPLEMARVQTEENARYRAEMEKYNAMVEAAEETLNAWTNIGSLINERKRAVQEQQRVEQRERDKQLHDEAVASLEEDKRIAAEKEAEQEAVGTHAVNPRIKEKWDNATKIGGNRNAITLADGSTVNGRYILTESGVATASHDVNNAFEPTEGFPIDENGESVNDRDYRRDKDAQRIVMDMADNYDSRALQTPVIVSKDGIVLSGNNRTMSGEIAARNNTDKAYVDYLREYGAMFGFTPEQIEGMKHPRVVFAIEEAFPYNANTFARFNAEQQKKQGKPEHAVKLGKIVPDNVFRGITNDISRFDRMSDYYADEKAISSAIKQLLDAGVINEMQLPELRTGNSLSAAGKELIENTLIGKVFQASPDAVRQIIANPTLRQSVVMSLNEIANNRTLAKSGYDLSKELAAAVDLVSRAKAESPEIYKEGVPVSPYGRQMGLFDEEYGDSRVTDGVTLLLADVLNSGRPSDLRKVLSTYNNEAASAAAGQMDVFSGDVHSKEQLLNDINEYFRNATPREQQAAVDAAVAERKRRAEAATQDADGAKRNGENPSEATAENGELDNNGRLEERRAKILSNMGDKYSLSEEHAGNGEAFIQNENGSTNLAKIPDEIFDRIGISPVPFKLTETMGWHVFDHHGKEVKLNSISDAVDFVLSIVNNADHVRLGRDNSYIFSVENNRKRVGRRAVTIMINSKTGEFMGIRTSGYETLKSIQERPLLWERGADAAPEDVATPTITTIEPQQGDERTSRTKGQSNVSSDGKDINNQSAQQENTEKSSKKEGETPLSEQIADASADVNTDPTEAQKKAGNYKKGHVQVGAFDITIEQPQGSVRRGKDANGKEWESRMNNAYGYIRGAVGVDGDHIDVFLSNDMDGWDGRSVYVVDQYNPDGSFDEHKVMLGFNDIDEAKSNYLANYEKGWEDGRRIDITGVNLEDFEKWIGSSKRKTKPFSEYVSVKKEEGGSSFDDFVRDSGGEVIPNGVTRSNVINFAERVLEKYRSHTESYGTYNAMRTDVENMPAHKLFKSESDWFSVKNGNFIAVNDTQAKACYELVAHKDAQGHLKSVSVIKYHSFDHTQQDLSFDGKGTKKDSSDQEKGEKNVPSDLEREYQKAVEHENDVEQKWEDKIQDYVAEHYPTQATVSAETTSAKGTQEREAMKSDPVLRAMRKKADAEYKEARDATLAVQNKESEPLLVKGEKWEATGEPAKFKARTKKNADSHDVLWTIGKKRYGSTVAERDLIEDVVKEYGGYVEAWNAYERGEIILPENEAAIIKEIIRTEEAAGRKPPAEAGKVRLQKAGIVDIESIAEEYGLDASDVKMYADGMRKGSLARAARALAEIGRKIVVAHEGEIHSLLDMRKFKKPVEKALKEAFGDVDVLIEERRKQAEIERSMMEAARKRAEEERRKREARLEELAGLTDEEIDHSYAESLAKGDEAAAREMLDEAARRKGYGDTTSDYQGVGAWTAPSDPGYESDEARRNAVGEDSPNLNVEDMASGYSNQPEDIFVHPDKYSQGLPTSKESGKAIQTAIDDIRNGKKDVKVKVYRAVPTSVKEGKLRNGDWVTPSKRYAELHGSSRLEGKYRIIEDEVPVSELWWDGNDVNEWGYDNGKGYKYKNVKNNRKLNDLVTRDDKGTVIPPSKRFNQRKADERYQRGVGGVKPSKAEMALRDAVIDRLRESGMDVITDVAEGQRVLDMANGKARQMSFGEAYDYDTYPLGRVEPNLAEKEVDVVEADVNHGFADYKEAKAWAKQHVSKVYNNEETGGKGDVRISNAVIDKFMSQSAVDKSDSKDVHMAVLKVLPEVLKSSIDVETHPDFLKGVDGKRRAENGMNKDVLVHRCYGAVSIDGKPYRVKITLKEDLRDVSFPHVTHSYEATKIELLAGLHGDVAMTSPRNSNSSKQVELSAGTRENQEGPSPNTNNSISAAKLLENVGMSYNPDEKVLDASEKRSNGVRFFRTANGEAYGFTVGGKIYIDPRIATSETPVHEYAHLWAEALRNGNSEEWRNVVELMKDTKVWDEVKARYPELKSDDEIADEVIAQYSGRRGADRLREEMRKAADSNMSAMERVNAIAAIQNVKDALDRFWKKIADFLHIHYTSAEEVADRVMKDLLDGVDPRKMGETKDDGVRFSAKQKRALETVSFSQDESYQQTAISSADGAKVLKNLDALAEHYANSPATNEKTFIGEVAKSLGIDASDRSSKYASFETKNGKVVTIRLSNHNAKASNFDMNNEPDGISIVVSPKKNAGITNDGNAHIVEFYYDSIKLRKADGKPLAEIVRSIKQALYNGEFKDTTGLAERQEVNGEDVIRYQFIGEQGAERADHAEEVTTRLDNLNVAREMEDAKKDAKVIKMATGWERGADGKWRYEIPDLKYFGKGDAGYQKAREKQSWSKELDGLSDRIFDGEDLSESEYQRFDELAQKEEIFKTDYLNREKPHLADWIENDELFNAYPDLKRVKMVFTDQMPANMGGYYDESEHTIGVNTNYVGDLASVLAHEVQHAIQAIEGFSRGGNPESIQKRFEAAKKEQRARAWADELRYKADEIDEHHNQVAVEKALIDEYKEMGMDNDEWMPDKETRMKGFNYFARGYADRSMDADIKNFRLAESTRADFSPYMEYTKLGGEVESRNVEKRMKMSPEERRAILAAETEDVSREDQVFLYGNNTSYTFSDQTTTQGAELSLDSSEERTRRLRNEAENAARALGVEVEIVDDPSTLEGKRAKAKGWFDPSTGKVTIVVGNHTSVGDIQATMLHEIVAHKGLRDLFGERFDEMVRRVFSGLDNTTKELLMRQAMDSGFDINTVTEEYLAGIAERGVNKPSVWNRVKSAIKETFRDMGINLRMSDEDIAYLLWKAKNHVKPTDSLRTIVDKVAADADMRDGLLYRGFGNGALLEARQPDRRSLVSLGREINDKIRNAGPLLHELYVRAREGWQDSQIRIRNWQDAIAREGHDVKDFEDYYTYHTQALSRASQDLDRFKNGALQRVWDSFINLSKEMDMSNKKAYRLIENYMMVKHGLERNAYMRNRDIQEVQKKADAEIADLDPTSKGYQQRAASIQEKADRRIEKLKLKDYSGLTALSKELLDSDYMDENRLRRWSDDFEARYDTRKLWDAVRATSQATLRQLRVTGQIDKPTLDKISDMYDFYVPLKDWDGKRATDLYEYTNPDQDIISNPLKTAKGRSTRAGNILANIASDYESATIMGYKNLQKQRLLNLVRNSGTRTAVASELWYTRSIDSGGNEVWEPALVEGFTEDPSYNAQLIDEFNERMEDLKKKGDAMTHKDVLRLGVPVKKWQEAQHAVKVKEAGKEIVVYFTDPKIAQAVNGLNNVKLDNRVLRAMNSFRQWMMLNYTAKNISFILRNMWRDISYVNTMNYVKYGSGFEKKFLGNYIPALRTAFKVEFGGKDANYERFVRNGGQTGYVESMGYERYKSDIEDLVRRSEGRNLKVKDFFHSIGVFIEHVNNAIENAARFAVYDTAKKSGFSELKAIEAAKEASVNFNRKGSGQLGAVVAQNAYFFFNAGMQGVQNFAHATTANRQAMMRGTLAMGFWTALGAVMPMLMSAIGGDDDEYANLPDHVRQNNIIFPIGDKKYVALPLSVEIRAFYGLGDMMWQAATGQYKGRDFALDAAVKLMDLLPKSVDFPNRGRNEDEKVVGAIMKNVTPDAILPLLDAYYFNENFFGKRVTGRTKYNEHVPEWQKATKGTSSAIIAASKKLNEATGGDYATKGWADNMLLNPSALEYLFEQYFGGVGKVIAQTYRTAEGIAKKDLYLRNIPVVSGLTYSTENMIQRGYTNERYNSYIDEAEETKSRLKKYKEGMAKGEDLDDRFDKFINSKEFERYLLVDKYSKRVKELYDMAKKLEDGTEEQGQIYDLAKDIKRQMIEEIDKMDQR